MPASKKSSAKKSGARQSARSQPASRRKAPARASAGGAADEAAARPHADQARSAGARKRGRAGVGASASAAGSAQTASPMRPAPQGRGIGGPALAMPDPVAGVPGWSFDPARLNAVQQEYLASMNRLLEGGPQSAAPSDKRFRGDSWQQGLFGWNAALYELNARFMTRLADAFEGDAKSRERVRFATQQWIDATSPTNYFVSNPEAQKRLLESGGESLAAGLRNLLADMQRGRISQTDETAFEVGRNLAVTPGKVVFQNELIQLIQYEPTTPRVGETPLLMVPPCINKFYILDLQPVNSVVAHLVGEGHTVFMLSWRNVKSAQGELTWDDYLAEGAIEAIRVSREITGVDKINALGFCVGGTIIATALAVLAARGERPVASLTLLTTLLDFENAGVLNIFVDEAHVAFREMTIGSGGIMAGGELAQTFSALRPNDLIWNYVVRNYLHGEAPPAFDLLYWNSDGTNLPGPMFCWYLRHLYLQNELCQPGRLACLGQPVDLATIDVPTYIYGSREDHIVPWEAAYASTGLLSNELRFVLGASGHIAGVINPPSKNKRSYWTNATLAPDAQSWMAGATEHSGSWWPDWVQWLNGYRGRDVAPRSPGSPEYPALEAAPGAFVREKAGA